MRDGYLKARGMRYLCLRKEVFVRVSYSILLELLWNMMDGWMIVFVSVSYSNLLKLLSNSMMDDCSPES